MTTVGFLHTSDVHILPFQALLSDVAPAAGEVHVVDEDLLTDARTRGVDSDIAARLLQRLRDLAELGPDVIVCTCSTLSEPAERFGEQLGIPVVRIDRPMAESAVAKGGRVAVVAAVASTMAPTRQLLEEYAAAAGTGAVILDTPCLGAWDLFEAGDMAGYLDRIAVHVRDLPVDVEVVVLAQASMAAAPALLLDLPVPVLSSPRPAVERAVELAEP